MKNIVHKIPCDIYNDVFYVTFSRDAIEKMMGDSVGECLGITARSESGRISIWIDCDGGLPYGTTAHEVFHAVDFMLNKKGVAFGDDGDNEHYAYMIGWLFNRVLDCWDAECDKKLNGSEK